MKSPVPGKSYAALADEAIAADKAWKAKWGEKVCVCGHQASAAVTQSRSQPNYHDPNQGTRCRAPGVDCKCEKFEPVA